jgi:hypothetical protein
MVTPIVMSASAELANRDMDRAATGAIPAKNRFFIGSSQDKSGRSPPALPFVYREIVSL